MVAAGETRALSGEARLTRFSRGGRKWVYEIRNENRETETAFPTMISLIWGQKCDFSVFPTPLII